MEINKFRIGLFVSAIIFSIFLMLNNALGLGYFGIPFWLAASIAIILLMPAVYIFFKVSRVRHVFFQPKELVSEGIYALLRHPRDAAFMFLICPAFWILTRAVILVAGIPVTMLVWLAVSELEEREMRKRHGAKHEEYSKKIPRIFPKFS